MSTFDELGDARDDYICLFNIYNSYFDYYYLFAFLFVSCNLLAVLCVLCFVFYFFFVSLFLRTKHPLYVELCILLVVFWFCFCVVFL